MDLFFDKSYTSPCSLNCTHPMGARDFAHELLGRSSPSASHNYALGNGRHIVHVGFCVGLDRVFKFAHLNFARCKSYLVERFR